MAKEVVFPLVRVPEFIICETLTAVLKTLRLDYEGASDKTKTILYYLCSGLRFQRYNYWEQSQTVFLRKPNEPRFLEVDLMFNMDRDGAPTIHVTTPGENQPQNQNAVGIDEGYFEHVVLELDSGSRRHSVFTRRHQATYDIVITSDNSNEVVMIYHIVRALLTSVTHHLSLKGLENINFSGQDLTPYMEMMPKNMYARAIRLALSYETSTVSLNNYPIIEDFGGVEGDPEPTEPTTTTTTTEPPTTTTTSTTSI